MNTETTIPELSQMVAELRECLKNKAESLNIKNRYVADELENRKKEIDSFEYKTREVRVSSFEKQTVIKNFKQEAERVKKSIDEIG